jgi:O-antigen ligase
MSQVTTAEFGAHAEARRGTLKLSLARILDKTVFVSLVCLIVFTAIPYGSSQAWWQAFFVCAFFTLAVLWLIEGLVSDRWANDGWPLVLPLAALAFFSFLQTLPLGSRGDSPGGLSVAPWRSISADPFQTRFVILELVALTIAGLLLFRYASSERRLRILINVIIGVAVASSLFGILRQTTQHAPGFGLPRLMPDLGYGQFINKNHFAFLMEMSFGLILGLILGGGVKREQALIYFAALLPLWTGLVLCGSRGGLIAMLAQIVIAALLVGVVARKGKSNERPSRLLGIARSLPVRAVLIFVLVGGVVFGTLWLGGDRLATSIEDSHSEFNPDPSNLRQGVSRNEIWKSTWKLIVSHPLLGVGMGGYWAAIPEFHDASGTMTPQEAHNDYLELLASGGLIGLALGIWFAVIVFRRIRRNLASASRFRRAASFGAAIGIAGVAVHSLVDFGLHTLANALVFTTLIVIATSNAPMEKDVRNA